MQLTPEHEALRDTLKRFIDQEVNPHVDAWEKAEVFPAHEIFRRMGQLGLLGLTKPVETVDPDWTIRTAPSWPKASP